ncbi:hypothetical protein H7849_09010 [Alloacidobacterium dinghuense]|uniref:DUF1440 domain-containing protein n=1 Tax=Alloacidobacterium dinghuense TaxID=2763107 RepID=A0A7G8BNA0_9BACT|nr:hypothetical protein [Alloacidobacterium dinghuense]QNI34020.1 hypothetical protein H7849_09010 [Alloacidobacterium dinghuense]
MATAVATVPRPRALATIAGGGLLAGFLDGSDAIIHYTFMLGIPARNIFRYIASGLIGMHAATQLGALGVLLGVILHFTIAIGAATVYYFTALKLPILIRRPYLSGAIFCVGLHLFMQYVVIPLSAVPKNPNARFSWTELASALFAHIVLIGFSISLIARHSARARPLPTP